MSAVLSQLDGKSGALFEDIDFSVHLGDLCNTASNKFAVWLHLPLERRS